MSACRCSVRPFWSSVQAGTGIGRQHGAGTPHAARWRVPDGPYAWVLTAIDAPPAAVRAWYTI